MIHALVFAALALALLSLFLRWREPRMIYFPQRGLEHTPGALGWRFEDVRLATADGETLHGWFVPAESPAALTVLFFHGNAGNISHRFDKLAVLRALGADTLIVDYRGYGESGGAPSEKGTRLDADAAYAWLRARRALDARRLVVYGESLGAAVAVDLAARAAVGGLVLESGFTSAVDVGREMLPFLPVAWIMRDRYDSVSKIGRVTAPILILHSRDDEFFGWRHPERLLRAARAPKELVELRGGHNDAFLVSAPVYRRALGAFLARVAGGGEPS
jgi:hypothetical protein